MEKIIFQIALPIHVICGIVSLAAGIVAMAARKRRASWHAGAGLVFYRAMNGVFLTALLFFILYPTVLKYQFFLGIGLVSVYPNLTGKRILQMKKEVNPSISDYALAIIIGLSGTIMLAFGLSKFMGYTAVGQYAILFILFGLLSLSNAYGDLKLFITKNAKKLHWLHGHAGKMTGAFAASFTAFSVNVVPRYLPDNSPEILYLAMWVVPGVAIGVIGHQLKLRFLSAKK